MRTSESVKEINKAIFDLQQKAEIIERTSTADVQKYTYKFAGLPKVWVDVKPLLKEFGLVIVQPIFFDGIDKLRTRITHVETGEWIEADSRLVLNREDPQGQGSAVTYARRYQMLAMLGLVTDEDNDATTSRAADGEMKRDWVRAYTIMAKKQNPDHAPTNNDFVKFMEEVYGKHPTRVLAKEHQQVLDTIKAFDNE